MPLIQQGPLNGFYVPDYDGKSILNLLSSIIRSRGGQSPHRKLKDLSAKSLQGARKVVYLVLDGMGAAQLDRYLLAGHGRRFFAAHPRRTISTVCPATTAAAVTTFGTGASPAEHGILGWHLHLPDLGLVGTILPGVTRTGSPLAEPEFRLDRYLRLPSHIVTIRDPRRLISWGRIPESRFNRSVAGWKTSESCSTLNGLARAIARFARSRGRGLAYAYWPLYDTLCHDKGCASRSATRHLDALDKMLARLARLLRGTGAALLITADHGLVDLTPGGEVDLRSVPGFYDCLSMLPSGDARQSHCFVRPGRIADFLRLARGLLADRCVCVTGQEFMNSGALGPGKPHPALESRVGDYVLLAKPGCAIAAPPVGFKLKFNRANHGGMSPEESLVPLYVLLDADQNPGRLKMRLAQTRAAVSK